MSATYEQTEDYTLCLSDAGMAACAADRANEKRMDHATSIHTAIFAGSAIGLVVTFGALVVTKILGA